MDSKKQTNRLINAIGTVAESSLVFYRAAIGAGATEGEATRLLQAYIAAMPFGKGAAGAEHDGPAKGGPADMTLDEIISNLEDQAKDRESSIDKDDPECIFRTDAKALREAVSLLENLTGEVAAARRDIAALLWLYGHCEYCAHGQKVSYSGASRWGCKLGGAAECRPEWRGRCPK